LPKSLPEILTDDGKIVGFNSYAGVFALANREKSRD
jgi:hypothetical protein